MATIVKDGGPHLSAPHCTKLTKVGDSEGINFLKELGKNPNGPPGHKLEHGPRLFTKNIALGQYENRSMEGEACPMVVSKSG